MFRSVVLGGAIAGLATFGAAGLMPAEAATQVRISVAIATPRVAAAYPYRPIVHPYRLCKPTYKRISYKFRGHRYSYVVRTGESCHWVYPPSPPRPPYPRPY